MSKTSYEIMYKFAAELEKSGGDWDEKVRLMELPTPEQLAPGRMESGQSVWTQSPQAPLVPGADKWVPSAPATEPKEPRPSELYQPEPSESSGESEWYNPEAEYDYEEEMERRFDSDIPDPEDFDPGYRYHPDEEPHQEHSDEEVLSMIQQDPIDVLTNLMLQRKPEYQKLEILLPLARGAVDWLTESNISPEKGTILYEEIDFILNLLNQIADERETKED